MKCPECGRDLGDVDGTDELVRCVFCGARLPVDEDEGWTKQELELERAEPEIQSVDRSEEGSAPDGVPESAEEPGYRMELQGGVSIIGLWAVWAGGLSGFLALSAVFCAIVAGGGRSGLTAAATLVGAGSLSLFGSRFLGRRFEKRLYGFGLGLVILGAFGFLFSENFILLIRGLLRSGGFRAGPNLERLTAGLTLSLFGAGFGVIFLRGIGWTRRATVGAVATWCVIVAMSAHAFIDPGGWGEADLLPGLGESAFILFMAICAGGVAWRVARWQSERERQQIDMLLDAIWPGTLLLATVWLVVGRGWPSALTGQPSRLLGWSLAVLGAGFAVPVAAGLLASFRSEGQRWAGKGAVRWGWWGAPGGAALILGTAYAGGHVDQGLAAVAAFGGAVSALLFGWLGSRGETLIGSESGKSGNWVARWALWPMAAGTGMILSGVPGMVGAFGPPGDAAPGTILATLLLWSVLLVWAMLMIWGLGVQSLWSARERPEPTQEDMNLLARPGMVAACVGIVLLALGAGAGLGTTPVVGVLLDACRDLARMCRMETAFERISTMVGAWWETAVPAPMGGCVGLMLCGLLFVVSFAASRGVFWARRLTGVLWVPVALLGIFVGVGLAAALLAPQIAGPWRTVLGRSLADHLALRFLMFFGVTAVLVRLMGAVRSALLNGAYVESQESPQARSFRSLRVFGAIALAVTTVLSAVLVWDAAGEAILFQLQELGERLQLSGMNRVQSSVELFYAWPGHAAGLGLLGFLALCIHEETRRGHLAAYPVVAVLWSGLLVLAADGCWQFVLSRSFPLQSGATAVIALLVILWLLLFVNVLRLWVVWWHSRGVFGSGDARISPSEWGIHPSESLGRLGGLSILVIGGVILVGLWGRAPAAQETIHNLERGFGRIQYALAYQTELLRIEMDGFGVTNFWLMGSGLGSLVLIGFHYLSAFSEGRVRSFVAAFWSVVLLGALMWLGRFMALRDFGNYSPARALGFAGLVVGILYLAANVSSSWVWLLRGRDEKR